MNTEQFVSNEHMEPMHSPFKCSNCGEGFMILAVQESDQDYRDLYHCEKCHHTDNIPSAGVLFGQFWTSFSGFAVCVFLLYEYVFFSTGADAALLSRLFLGVIVGAFTLGFCYVLRKALLGLRARKRYLHHQR